jgi:alkylhydroperoxidase family enzyme
MTQRIDYQKQSPALFKKFVEFSMAFNQSAIEEPIRDLVDLRASQINGCAFCLVHRFRIAESIKRRVAGGHG